MNKRFSSLSVAFIEVGLTPELLGSYTELEQFQEAYNHSGDVSVDMPYLISADKVVVLKNQQNQWFGGYVVNTGRLRYLEPFSVAQVSGMQYKAGISFSDVAEISCIWRTTQLKGVGLLAPLFLYYCSILHAVQTGKEYTIGGSVVPKIWQNFEKAMPHELFYGPVDFKGHECQAKIVYNSALGLQTCYSDYLTPLMKRMQAA